MIFPVFPMKETAARMKVPIWISKRLSIIDSSHKACPALALAQSALLALSDKKVCQLKVNLSPKRTWRLIRSSFANVHLMKANYGEMSTEKCMAFCNRHERANAARTTLPLVQ